MHTPDQSVVIPGRAKRWLTQALCLPDEATLGDMLAEIDRLRKLADAPEPNPDAPDEQTEELFPAWQEDADR